MTHSPALREGPAEAGGQVFLELGPSGGWNCEESSCRPAGILACAWAFTPAILFAWNPFSLWQTLFQPETQLRCHLLQEVFLDSRLWPPQLPFGMAVFLLIFLYCNCLHTWLVCFYQTVSNLGAGTCLFPHCSPRGTTGTQSVVIESSSQKCTTMDKTCPCVFAVMVELPPQPTPLYKCSPQAPAHVSHARDHATQHPSQVLGGKDHSKWPRRGSPNS